MSCRCRTSMGSSTADDEAESTLGGAAHRLGQVAPMTAQQLHVKVMRPARAHMVNTSTVTRHRGRMRIWHTRR